MDDRREESNNFRINLISSLFGQQTALAILADDHNPTKFDLSYACPHPIFIGKFCIQCGHEIDNSEISTLPFRYIYPNLTLSLGEINRIRDQNLQSLLTRKKLQLVIDLDHTLVHQRVPCKLTTDDKKFLKSQKHRLVDRNDNFIEGGSLIELSHGWVKLRPFVRDFLEEASTMFDMTIYTLGGRATSWTITKLLDPEGMYFDNCRVISREDYCGALDNHKKSLDLVLEHEKVVVLDDREKVWEDYKANYVKVIPYNFFSFTSVEDKVYDASPPRDSWMQLGGDESEENGVLAKVLGKLRAFHSVFYDDGDDFGDYGSRDVREVIQRVETMSQKCSKKKELRRKKKTGRRVRN